MDTKNLRKRGKRRARLPALLLLSAILVGSVLSVPVSAHAEAAQISPEAPDRAQPGDIIRFGAYQQDGSFENGAEEIEWLVLERENDRLLVISRCALDVQWVETDVEAAGGTWGECSLRSWLNEAFLDAAFSEQEQAMIPEVTVSADRNPRYDTDPGTDVTDRIFLLSIEEAERYFGSDSARQCTSTEFAQQLGSSNVEINGSGAGCVWWLRSPGM